MALWVSCPLQHLGYLFTNDPDYLIQHGSMEPMYKSQQPQKPPQPVEEEKKEPGMAEKTFQQVKDGSKQAYQTVSSTVGSMLKKNESQERRQARYSGPFVQEIRKRLDSYFEVTVRNIRDSVPKAIGFYLVRAVQDKLQFALLSDFDWNGTPELYWSPKEGQCIQTQMFNKRS